MRHILNSLCFIEFCVGFTFVILGMKEIISDNVTDIVPYKFMIGLYIMLAVIEIYISYSVVSLFDCVRIALSDIVVLLLMLLGYSKVKACLSNSSK